MAGNYDPKTDSYEDSDGMRKSRQKMEIELSQAEATAKQEYNQWQTANTTDGSGRYDPNVAAEHAGYWKDATARVRRIKKMLGK